MSQKDLNRRESNYQESLSSIDVAKENLRAARLNLAYTKVHASVDGYVSNVDFQIGSQAIANNPIIALVDSNSFWVFGYFRESQIGKKLQARIAERLAVSRPAVSEIGLHCAGLRNPCRSRSS